MVVNKSQSKASSDRTGLGGPGRRKSRCRRRLKTNIPEAAGEIDNEPANSARAGAGAGAGAGAAEEPGSLLTSQRCGPSAPEQPSQLWKFPCISLATSRFLLGVGHHHHPFPSILPPQPHHIMEWVKPAGHIIHIQ